MDRSGEIGDGVCIRKITAIEYQSVSQSVSQPAERRETDFAVEASLTSPSIFRC